MQTYKVIWAIEIEAATPQDAARKARDIQLDVDSLATVFDVENWDMGERLSVTTVDLLYDS